MTRSLSILRRAVGAALVAACVAAAPGATAGGGLHTVELTMRGGRLVPETLEIPARTRVKIVIRNEGPGPAEFESHALGLEKVLAAGAKSFVVVAPQKPGEYDMFDEFHPATGRGRIVVK